VPGQEVICGLEMGLKNDIAKWFLIPALAGLVGLPLDLLAGSTGKIAGRVTDRNGNPLPGTNVLIVGTYVGAAADAEGYYTIINVPPGTYTLRFSMIGYKKLEVTGVQVIADLTTRQDVQLELKVVESAKTVVVQASRPIVQKDLTSTEENLSLEQISALPVTNLNDVINLQAGMVDGHLRGGRQGEVSYLVDGIPIDDSYEQSPVLLVENEVVQQLKVVSGTFNAEYGQAQSGVIDISTQEGAVKPSLRFSLYTGTYLTGHNDIFQLPAWPNSPRYQEASVYWSGPLGAKQGLIFNLKRRQDDGYLYGKRHYLPSVPLDSIAHSDDAPVAMSPENIWSLFTKLTWWASNKDKFNLSLIGQQRDNRDYVHLFRWNPDGAPFQHSQSWLGILAWNHVFNPQAFLNVSLAWSEKNYRRSLYGDPQDPRYAPDGRLRQTPSLSFYTGGTDMSWFKRSTAYGLLKMDYTRQLSRVHQLKAGLQLTYYDLLLHDIRLKKNAETGFQVKIPPEGTADNQFYHHYPLYGAAFVQTKSEYRNFILNLGLRLDYFNSRGRTEIDLTRPQTSATEPAPADIQISPRLGMAYPITDKGVMHISYGHFFQIPAFQYLYANPSRAINPEEGRASVLSRPFGNAALKSQKTVAFEIGLQQELAPLVGLNLVIYSKDVRNLLSSEINIIAPGENHSGTAYGRYINADFGLIRGLTLSLEKRPGAGGFSGGLDYTYQVAKGNASDPRATLIDNLRDPPQIPEKTLRYLDWDQQHTLNVSVSLSGKAYLLTLVSRFGSGKPYTPAGGQLTGALVNRGRKPIQLTFDLFGRYQLSWRGVRPIIYLKVFNLFDRLNEREVYSDTGRATYTEELYRGGEAQGENTKEEFFTRPDWFSSPRQLLIGMELAL